MEDTLQRVHTFKDGFLLAWAGTKSKDKGIAPRMEQLINQREDEETIAETWTLSKNQSEMNATQDQISHKLDVGNELDSNFSILKIHLMSHRVKQICRYGALQQILLRDINKHIIQISETVGTPPITMSTTCCM
jgi:hypothetical protein